MLNLAFIAITVLFPLFAVELKDVQRTEDWEVFLNKAGRLTKVKCRNNHGAIPGSGKDLSSFACHS